MIKRLSGRSRVRLSTDSYHLRVESGKQKTREDEIGVETEKMIFLHFGGFSPFLLILGFLMKNDDF